jgi:hypothetical protein
LSKWELRGVKTPRADGEAEEEVVVVSGRSAGKKLKQKRRKMRRSKTSTWIHISHETRYPSIVRSSPNSNMGERRGGRRGSGCLREREREREEEGRKKIKGEVGGRRSRS